MQERIGKSLNEKLNGSLEIDELDFPNAEVLITGVRGTNTDEIDKY